jgi:hypothetical protein
MSSHNDTHPSTPFGGTFLPLHPAYTAPAGVNRPFTRPSSLEAATDVRSMVTHLTHFGVPARLVIDRNEVAVAEVTDLTAHLTYLVSATYGEVVVTAYPAEVTGQVDALVTVEVVESAALSYVTHMIVENARQHARRHGGEWPSADMPSPDTAEYDMNLT